VEDLGVDVLIRSQSAKVDAGYAGAELGMGCYVRLGGLRKSLALRFNSDSLVFLSTIERSCFSITTKLGYLRKAPECAHE
jgi:hypothetical protein